MPNCAENRQQWIRAISQKCWQPTECGVVDSVYGLIPRILGPEEQNGLPSSSPASSQLTQLMLPRGTRTLVDQKSCIDDVDHVDYITIYRCSAGLLPHSEDLRWDSGQTHLELMSGIKGGLMLMEFSFPGIVLSYVSRCLNKPACPEKKNRKQPCFWSLKQERGHDCTTG